MGCHCLLRDLALAALNSTQLVKSRKTSVAQFHSDHAWCTQKLWLSCVCACAKSLQLCPTLCVPIDCSPPGSSVHGILQARILEWVAISFSKGTFPALGSNPNLSHCRQILYCLSYLGSSTRLLRLKQKTKNCRIIIYSFACVTFPVSAS